MKSTLQLLRGLVITVSMFASAVNVRAQGTAFTYQGRLIANGTPANGSYDLQFSLRDAAVAGNPVGATNTIPAVTVNNGLFTVSLDFGSSPFTDTNRWLEIAVRTNNAGLYVTLAPRQLLTAAPYAIAAVTAINLAGVVEYNTNSGEFATVGGGQDNTSSGQWATVGGGVQNIASGFEATVGGGIQNLSSAVHATVGGGLLNISSGGNATVGGGAINTSSGNSATVAGGADNTSSGNSATVGGGFGNTSSRDYATVSGGFRNNNSGQSATIGGGFGNIISNFASYATVPGGFSNTASAVYATVGGGSLNSATNAYATVSGGAGNTAGGQFSFAVGHDNRAAGEASSVSGGRQNFASGSGSFIGGGGFDGTNTFGNAATGGGSVIAGGLINRAAGLDSAVGGGLQNTVTGDYGTVPGGHNNASRGNFSTVGGGFANESTGEYATIPGGEFNTASGHHSFAAGRRARATNDGAFVWADSQDADFASTINNQFNIRAQGGVRLSDDTPGLSFGSTTRQMLNLWGTQYGIGVQSSTVYFRTDNASGSANGFAWYSGGVHDNAAQNPGGGATLMKVDGTGLTVNGVVVSASDRNIKAGFAPVDSKAVLEKVVTLPITRWHFTNDSTIRHVGPMAQDFHAAFGLGTDDKHIATVDADGVALAAIQGLNQKLEERLKGKDAEIAELRLALVELTQLVKAQTSR